MSDTRAQFLGVIERLTSPAQQVAALTHLEAGDHVAVLLVLGAPPSIYKPWDAVLIAAFLAGYGANLKD